MSLHRIVLTASELRAYKPACPEMNPHPAQAVLDKTYSTSHVTAEFAFAVAVDLLGLETALTFVRETPLVLAAWVNQIETYGWGNHLRTQDLQINLLLNAIKITARVSVGLDRVPPAVLEQAAHKLIQKVSAGDKELDVALTTSLLLNKGLEIPWGLVTNVSTDPKDTSYGVFEPKK